MKEKKYLLSQWLHKMLSPLSAVYRNVSSNFRIILDVARAQHWSFSIGLGNCVIAIASEETTFDDEVHFKRALKLWWFDRLVMTCFSYIDKIEVAGKILCVALWMQYMSKYNRCFCRYYCNILIGFLDFVDPNMVDFLILICQERRCYCWWMCWWAKELKEEKDQQLKEIELWQLKLQEMALLFG